MRLLGGRVKAGEIVISKLQWCSGCGKWMEEKRLTVENTQQTMAVAGVKGFWERGLEQGVWVQGREELQWFHSRSTSVEGFRV
jgi:hypothetical protein